MAQNVPLSPGRGLGVTGTGLRSFYLQAYAMNYWRKLGAPSEKLIMGFPTYGRTFHLLKATNHGLQAQAIGPASPGKYTKQAGFLAYYEVMGVGTSVWKLGLPCPSWGKDQSKGQWQEGRQGGVCWGKGNLPCARLSFSLGEVI